VPEKWLRDYYTETLITLGEENRNIVLLEADLMRANGTTPFKDKFPERTFNVGVAEANMVGIASGLSAAGKIPFADSFGPFSSRRAFDQFFISANYAGLNVKLTGSDPGISAEWNGGTHMPFEDVGLMRTIPHLLIYEPCDRFSLQALLRQSSELYGCAYLRLYRKAAQDIYSERDTFTLGKGNILRDGEDLTIIANGAVMIPEVLKAADELERLNISTAVIDMHTVKPLDVDLIVRYARKTQSVLVCDNHQVIGGLGSAVAEVLGEHCPTHMMRLGVNDEFGAVGPIDYLRKRYGLNVEHILDEAEKLLKIKKDGVS
jgi:transketolase